MHPYLRRNSSPLSNGGFFLRLAELHSPTTHGQRTATIRGRRGIQGEQVNGSSLPMCFLLNSLTHTSFNRTYGQIPFVLSHPSSLSPFQQIVPLVRFHNCLLERTACSLYCSSYNTTRYFSNNVVDSVRSDSDIESDDGNESRVVDDVECEIDEEAVVWVCRVIDETFAFDRNMEAILDGCEIHLSHDLVLAVLERFRHSRKPAFRFFCWAAEKPGFAHDSRTYNKMMNILGKTRQFETMVSFLEEMGEKGLLTLETFSICIKSFAAAKERKKAVGMFDLMKKHKFKVGVETFNCLLDALGRAKLGKEAQVLFDKLEDRFTQNLQTYTILLNGWCKLKNLMEAGRVWNGMIDNGFKPDIVAHNIMLEGLLRSQKRSDAIKLFEVMKSKGPLPSVRSYTVLIEYLCKHGNMNLAIDYFDDMRNSDCEPDAALYTCLIIGFGNYKKMDVVFRLIKEMTEKGCPPDGRTYNALIKMMVNRHMPDEAVKIYKKMILNEVEPTIHTFNMMMKSFFVAKNYEMGCAVWEEMKRKGCSPDENAYTILIGSLLRLRRSSEACKYLEEMMDKGMRAPQLDYKKLVSDFSRSGKVNVLVDLAEKMKLMAKSEVADAFVKWRR